jgi:selenide,water dikinase
MKRIVLLGGGHAHVHVLDALARFRLDASKLYLVSPYARQVYSGMLPGWIAGHYRLDDCVIPLPPIAERAHATFVQTHAVGVDPQARRVLLENGTSLPYDVLSIDTGPLPNRSLPGVRDHAVSVRPIESFIESFRGFEQTIFANAANGVTTRIVFAGAGAAGIELAFAIEARYRASNVRLILVSAANTLPGGVGPRIERALGERRIALMVGRAVARFDPHAVVLDDGSRLEADIIIAATGSVAAAWPRASGLATDEGGFIRVNQYLQSVSHPDIFAAGDCASVEGHARPKSGVFAVRAGPPLVENLRRAATGRPLKPHIPQSRSLYLLSTGNRNAIGSWGEWSWEGEWVWRWKDRIDRAFIAKYAKADRE